MINCDLSNKENRCGIDIRGFLFQWENNCYPVLKNTNPCLMQHRQGENKRLLKMIMFGKELSSLSSKSVRKIILLYICSNSSDSNKETSKQNVPFTKLNACHDLVWTWKIFEIWRHRETLNASMIWFISRFSSTRSKSFLFQLAQNLYFLKSFLLWKTGNNPQKECFK